MRDWPQVKMSRIIWHWTAGTYTPSDLDLSHYHFVIDGNGQYHDGVNIEYNAAPIDLMRYAAHTKQCNSESIGISVAAMAGAKTVTDWGTYPVKRAQIDTLISLSVALGHFYNIPVTDKTMLSHAEVENNLGIKQRGKWDIAVFPFMPSFNTAKLCGDYLRSKVQEGLNVHNG